MLSIGTAVSKSKAAKTVGASASAIAVLWAVTHNLQSTQSDLQARVAQLEGRALVCEMAIEDVKARLNNHRDKLEEETEAHTSLLRELFRIQAQVEMKVLATP